MVIIIIIIIIIIIMIKYLYSAYMVWERHRHGKSSKMHLTSWNTLEKKAKSVLTFLPKLKPLYANSTIREHKRWKSTKKEQTMVWNKALEACPSLPKPEDSGWYYSEGLLKPKLMTRE